MPASLTAKTKPSEAAGEACIGTPLVCSHATAGVAPGRTARTVGAPKPDTVTTSPPAITGDGTTPSPVLGTDHRRAPVAQVERLHDVAGRADQHVAGADARDDGRDVRDAREAAAGLPSLAARARVERDDEGLIPRRLPSERLVLALVAAVARHDHQVAVQHERGPQPVLAVERVVAVRPDDLAVEHVDGDEAAVAEARVDAGAVGDRRRRRIRVPAFLALQRLGEDQRVPQHLAGPAVERQHVTRPALVARGGHENPAAPHDGRRPALARNRRLPQRHPASRSTTRAAGFPSSTPARSVHETPATALPRPRPPTGLPRATRSTASGCARKTLRRDSSRAAGCRLRLGLSISWKAEAEGRQKAGSSVRIRGNALHHPEVPARRAGHHRHRVQLGLRPDHRPRAQGRHGRADVRAAHREGHGRLRRQPLLRACCC